MKKSFMRGIWGRCQNYLYLAIRCSAPAPLPLVFYSPGADFLEGGRKILPLGHNTQDWGKGAEFLIITK